MNKKSDYLIGEIANHISKLKRKNELHIGVTNVIKINTCPRQVLFFSLSKFAELWESHNLKPSISKSSLIGTLSHYAFYFYYSLKYQHASDLTIKTLISMAFNKLKEEKKAEYKVAMEKKDEIIEDIEKYVKTFVKWASFSPNPSFCEMFVQYNLLRGIIDRIDIIDNKLLITDYKTSNSAPNEQMLEEYKEQLGGYCYLVQRSKLNKYELMPPRIIVFKKATWNTYVVNDFKNYIEDFEVLLKKAVKYLIDLTKGKIPQVKPINECSFCLNKEICAQFY